MISYEEMMKRISRLAVCRERWCSVSSLGVSRAGRDIPLIRFGSANAPKCVLYVGVHHALEAITAELLLRFSDELAGACDVGGDICNVNIRGLFDMRRILVVPMLNPDGVELVRSGAASAGDYSEIAEKAAGGSFSRWQANAAGVDLNHNYKVGFSEYKELEASAGISAGASLYSGEYPESEPESAALASLARSETTLAATISLHTQGEEIYAKHDERNAAKRLAAMSGYSVATPDGTARFGGFSDYVGDGLGLPAFTVECGRGKNPLPDGDAAEIYFAIREMLVRFPTFY